jgi:hypothetical protein
MQDLRCLMFLDRFLNVENLDLQQFQQMIQRFLKHLDLMQKNNLLISMVVY